MELKTGDVILEDYHHPNYYINLILRLQDYFDLDRWNHAMIYHDDGEALESNVYGIVFRKIKMNRNYLILRLKQKIDHELMKVVIEDYVNSIGPKYGYHSALNAAISVLTRYFFGKRLKLFKDHVQPHCSELVLEILQRYGIDLEVDDDISTPNDIYRMDIFEVVEGGDKDGFI